MLLVVLNIERIRMRDPKDSRCCPFCKSCRVIIKNGRYVCENCGKGFQKIYYDLDG